MIRLLGVLMGVFLGFTLVKGQTDVEPLDTIPIQDTLIVGIKESPPFTYKDENGQYIGIGVYLWEAIAKSMDVAYSYQELSLAGILDGLEKNTIDLAINPLTVTSHRIQNMDFTQPFFISNSVIAIPKEGKKGPINFFMKVFSLRFAGALFLLVVVVLIFGTLVWFFERKKNDQFENNSQGIWDGVWWAAVTMTTVGYGDKVPKTIMGRMIGLVWMFSALLLVSGLMAGIASALTINQLESKWTDVNDLRKVKTGTVEQSASEVFLQNHFIRSTPYSNLSAGLQGIQNSEIEAFVYDEPILRYQIEQDTMIRAIEILPFQFNTQYYSFATPKDSKWIDRINPILLEYIETTRWKATLTDYGLIDM
ncbi:MAG: transporter substrate-binding domain-containing protein [Aureispira sp.]|nr:transporter substrate-binding domain-containing protein [Aureispira sp.]